MNETSKCEVFRRTRGDYTKYLKGRGIDIGCGTDPLRVPGILMWDTEDGDAQTMGGLPDDTYDFVYSSHCLEHLDDVPTALASWSRILKPGGFLYIVVPEYVMYEKCCWPSRFNADHKQTFSVWVKRTKVKRTNHWHIGNVMRELSGVGCVGIEFDLEDYFYDWNGDPCVDQTLGEAVAQIRIIARKMKGER